jgi:hypothetical protein
MIGAFRESRYVRAVLAAALALVLSVRILVPAGFMPVQTPHGLVVKMCGGGADSGKLVRIALPMSDEDGSTDHQSQPENTPCAFAAVSAPALPAPAVPVLASPDQLPHERSLPPRTVRTTTRADFILPPLRGPPALA